MMRPPANVIVAVFHPEEWKDLRTYCDDLPETYEEWLTGVRHGLAEMELTFEQAIKIVVTADQLKRLYEARKRTVTVKDRTRLAHRLHLEMRLVGTRH